MRIIIADDFKKLFDPLTPSQLALLKEQVLSDRGHLILPRILVWPIDKKKALIVDGHNQYDLRIKNGCTVKYHTMSFKDRDAAKAYARRVQLARRNLSAGQWATEYAKVCPAQHGGDHTSEAAQEQGSIVNLAQDERGASKPVMAAANRVVKEGSAALIDACCKGEVGPIDATAVLHLPKGKQDELLAKLRAGKITSLKKGVPKKKKRDKAVEFDPKEIEKTNGRKTKSGKPFISVKMRKTLNDLLGKLIRALDDAEIGDEFADCMEAMATRFKEV